MSLLENSHAVIKFNCKIKTFLPVNYYLLSFELSLTMGIRPLIARQTSTKLSLSLSLSIYIYI